MEIKNGYKQTEVGVIPEDWEVKSLGELFQFSGGLAASREQLSDVGFCYLHYGDIHKSKRTYIDISEEYSEIPKLNIAIKLIPTKSFLNDGDVVFVDASEDDEGASKHVVVRNPKGITYISGLHTIVSKSKDDSLGNSYKQYCFQTNNVKQQFKFYAAGTKVTGISKTNIAKIQIARPPKAEQTAIATVLSGTDALINSLQKLITKKRNIKRGAMQQLLTGKKRLPGFSGEWEVKRFKDKDVTKLITCGIAATPEYVDENSGVPFLSSTNVKDGKVMWKDFKFISKDLHDNLYKNNPPLRGDILYSRVGTIGEAAIIDVDFEFSVYVSLTLIKTGRSMYNKFLKQLLNSSKYKELAKREVLLGSGVGNLNVNVVREFSIPLPSIDEQTAIAQVLSDMDTEIEELDRKLAKYRLIKQGMMQELLTGKTRLI
jgi:type I restriction enzyme S subunit